MKMQAGLKTYKMCKDLHLQTSVVCCINNNTKEVLFTSNLSCSLLMNSQKRLTLDVSDTYTTHFRTSSLVHDITDTNCWAQNGSTQLCFCNFQMPIFNKLLETKWKTAVCLYCIPFLQIGPVMLLYFSSLLNSVILISIGNHRMFNQHIGTAWDKPCTCSQLSLLAYTVILYSNGVKIILSLLTNYVIKQY